MKEVTIQRNGDICAISFLRNQLIFSISSQDTNIDSTDKFILKARNCGQFIHDTSWVNINDSIICNFLTLEKRNDSTIVKFLMPGDLIGSHMKGVTRHYQCLWGATNQCYLLRNNKKYKVYIAKEIPVNYIYNEVLVDEIDSILLKPFVPVPLNYD